MKDGWALLLLIIGMIFINYSIIDSFLVRSFEDVEYGVIERVVDGDTIVVATTRKLTVDSKQSTVNGQQLTADDEQLTYKVRMLGINTPEKGEWLYDEAREFMDGFNGSEVVLEFGSEKFDRYGRTLAYVFVDGVNLNLEIVRQGLANAYFPAGRDKYYDEFYYAWEECMQRSVGFCATAEEECLEFDWKPTEDYVLIRNVCSSGIDFSGWSIKDEGRKKFVFEGRKINGYEEIVISNEDFLEDYVWTRSGDSIFVRNAEGGIVYFDKY
ncbi:MAG: thermonuclease family protein [Nanoarchaeota archaeon]|jgi:endonuclease YncB( thermonuclease family)|nr:thermonuclease family protein [Nanoarchaeota archaeon]